MYPKPKFERFSEGMKSLGNAAFTVTADISKLNSSLKRMAQDELIRRGSDRLRELVNEGVFLDYQTEIHHDNITPIVTLRFLLADAYKILKLEDVEEDKVMWLQASEICEWHSEDITILGGMEHLIVKTGCLKELRVPKEDFPAYCSNCGGKVQTSDKD